MALDDKDISEIKQDVENIRRNIQQLTIELNEASNQLSGVSSHLQSTNNISSIRLKAVMEYFKSVSQSLAENFQSVKKIKSRIEEDKSQE